MKQSTLLLLVIFIGACTKKDSDFSNANTPPIANAGEDQLVFLPADSCILAGAYTGSTIQSVMWRKVSGPNHFVIANPHLLTTKVHKLKKGVYEFELTVITKSHQQSKDTINISVKDTINEVVILKGENEVIFKNLTWIFPWGAALEIEKIRTHVPEGSPLKVFIQRGSDTNWTEVPQSSSNSSNDTRYDYFIETRPDGAGIYTYGSLYIFFYGDNTNDKPKVKIVF